MNHSSLSSPTLASIVEQVMLEWGRISQHQPTQRGSARHCIGDTAYTEVDVDILQDDVLSLLEVIIAEGGVLHSYKLTRTLIASIAHVTLPG
jgi:hypothetical protein